MVKKHLLFVCYGGGHVAMLYPVIQKLKDNYTITILALTTAQSFLAQKKIPFIGYKDFPEAKNAENQEWGNRLSSELPQNNLVSQEESIAYLGINFCELIETHGLENAKILYHKQGRQSFLPIRTMERLLKRITPDIVISTNSPRTEQAVFLAAKNLNIPAVCLIDLFALQAIQWIGQPGYAKKLCVLNNFVKNNFIQAGRTENEVVVTGNPIFDMLHFPTTLQKGILLKQEKKWDDGKINILWASQPEPQQHPFCKKTGNPTLLDRIEKILRNLVYNNPNFRLIIRYHPSENKKFILGKNVDFSPCTEPIEPLLHAIDLVVVTASTVGLQAHLIGKPVISVDCSIWSEDVIYAQQGISIGVKHVEKLASTILSIDRTLKNKENDTYPTNATQNVVHVIEGVLNGK